jgi:CrcB protein
MIVNCLVVGAGGALGAISRYLFFLFPFGTEDRFPVITLGINLAGSFCIGLIAALSAQKTNFDPRLLMFLRVGLCGGFTTFSAFSLETVELLQSGKYGSAVLYAALSIILCIAATAGAQVIVK